MFAITTWIFETKFSTIESIFLFKYGAGFKLNEDQWYVHDGKVLTGPFTEHQLSLFPAPSRTLSSRFVVSKVGQDRWISLLSWKQTRQGAVAGDLENSATDFENFTTNHLRDFKSFIGQSLATVESAQFKEQAKETREKPAHDQSKQHSSSSALALPVNKVELAKKHMSLQGVLNLGIPKSIFFEGFIRVILTLGISSIFWLKSSWQELGWYLTGRPPSREIKFWSLMVPWGCFLWVFKLAKKIQTAEGKNGYSVTNPYLAVILTLVPPLVICYLQSAINNLWVSAIKNYEARR